MTTHFIVCADDFGLTRGINRGIIESHLHGIVTATSLMVNAPYAEEAVKEARSVPELDIGVHLNLVDGEPVLAPERVRTLVDPQGNFFGFREFKRRAVRNCLNRSEVSAELTAQIRRAFELGIRPTHIDSHHHVHILPGVYKAVPQVMSQFPGVPLRAYRYTLILPKPRTLAIDVLKYYLRNPHRFCTHNWARYVTGFLSNRGIPHSDSMLIPVADGKVKVLKGEVDVWRALIRAARKNAVNEVFCHPGYNDGGFCGDYTHEREQEIAALTSPLLREELERSGVTLSRYSQVFPTKEQPQIARAKTA